MKKPLGVRIASMCITIRQQKEMNQNMNSLMKYLILVITALLITASYDGSNLEKKKENVKNTRAFEVPVKRMGEIGNQHLANNYTINRYPEVSPDGTLVVYNGERKMRETGSMQ